jgi:ABC-type multidrug transport system fused ATPase/permease subunit
MDLPEIFILLLLNSTFAIQIFVFCIAATPYFVIIMIPIGFGYYLLGGYLLVSSRELKRLDSATRSPIYTHFGETLAGLTSIRAFQDSDRFAIDATTLLDRSQQTSYLSNATTRWLMLMLDTMSVLIISVVALLAVVQRGSEGAGLFSIVLSQIGILTAIMEGLLSTACNMETAIISVERVREYSQLTPEARDVIPDSKTDEAWPQIGKIEFNSYSTRYREGLDLVLKDLSLTIQGGERVGIVGRTGAGKSSVTLSLFRIVEAVEGSITIDGIDISTLGLTELRSRITIIPQDPFLFGASIRSNLDPFDKYTDADIWEALESASLKSYIQTLPEGLSTVIDNGGENMSLGQRQLMSLARAMLAKNTRILCLDEATAAIDIETDNAIQRALRRGFPNCTVLTIAHRINTIMDSDRILVLDKGRVAEFDSPKTLLQNKESIFFSLANTSGHA